MTLPLFLQEDQVNWNREHKGHGGPSFLKRARLSTISVQTHSVSLHLEGDELRHPRLVEAVMAAGAPRGQKMAVALKLE